MENSGHQGWRQQRPTLRARVRAAEKYLSWLAVSPDVAFLERVAHFTSFLESRHSEPCNRGALKAAHQCMVFMEDVTGVEEKLTTNASYTVVYRELLSTAQPSRVPKQALRYPAAVLESLETLILLQCWATLRFADHRGLCPSDGFEVRGNALTARLVHSKTERKRSHTDSR